MCCVWAGKTLWTCMSFYYSWCTCTCAIARESVWACWFTVCAYACACTYASVCASLFAGCAYTHTCMHTHAEFAAHASLPAPMKLLASMSKESKADLTWWAEKGPNSSIGSTIVYMTTRVMLGVEWWWWKLKCSCARRQYDRVWVVSGITIKSIRCIYRSGQCFMIFSNVWVLWYIFLWNLLKLLYCWPRCVCVHQETNKGGSTPTSLVSFHHRVSKNSL